MSVSRSWLRDAVLLMTFFAPLAAVAAERFPPADQLPVQEEMPSPLAALNGERISTPEAWREQRRPELVALIQHYMYGYLPASPERIESKVEREDKAAFGGKATLKEVTIAFGPADAPRIHLLLVVPNLRAEPAPVFLGMNFSGNHTLVADPEVRLPTAWMYGERAGVKDNRATDEGRGTAVDVWAIEQSIDRGYAVATFYSGDIDPDRADARQGIHRFFHAADETGSQDYGSIAAWAWGLMRAVDYLCTDHDIDKNRIAIVGHSRLGKTALLAGALDERVALVIPHQSGCGGAAPSRGTVGESVKRINSSFPHWFNAEFKKFGDEPQRLPFDQNCVLALVAPRPLLLTNAVEDTWANPDGQFAALKSAAEVYKLLGVEGLAADEPPPPEKLVDSRVGYYVRPGKHSMTREDWAVFLDFADRRLHAQAKPVKP